MPEEIKLDLTPTPEGYAQALELILVYGDYAVKQWARSELTRICRFCFSHLEKEVKL